MTMLRKFSFLFPDMRATAQRFPLSLICGVLLFFTALAGTHEWTGWEDETLGRAAVWLSCGYFIAGGIRLLAESRNWRTIYEYALFVPVMAALGALFFLSPQWHLHGFFLVPAILLFVLVAPFINRHADDDAGFYKYGQALTLAIVIGAFAGGLLFAGSAAALGSVAYLFEADIDEKIYFDIFFFCAILFTPFYALSWIPARMDAAEADIDLPRAQLFILNWVLAPLVAVYFLILYAYALKIGVQGELPRGQLAYMITGFGGAGMIAYLASWPLRSGGGGTKLLRFVHRWFFPALILPAALMALAIGTRLNTYGVTEQRYIIALASVWFLATSLLFTVRGRRLPLKAIPAFLAVLFLIGAFGPWGGVSLSGRSQTERLENVLTENSLLQDEHVTPRKDDIPFESRKTASSIMDYLIETRRTDDLRRWFADTKPAASEKDGGARAFPRAEALMARLGQDYVGSWARKEGGDNWSFYAPPMKTILDVAGYDVFLQDVSAGMHDGNDFAWTHDVPPSGTWPATTLSIRDDILEVTVAGRRPLRFDLHAYAQEGRGATEAIIRDAAGPGLRGRLIISSFSGARNDDGKLRINSITFDLLLARR